MPGTKYFTHLSSFNPNNGSYEVGAIIIHVLWMKKPRQSSAVSVPQVVSSNKPEIWDLNSGSLPAAA